MTDANLRDFYNRVQRIQKTYRRGGGFEAPGTLGRSFFLTPPGRRVRFGRLLRPALYAAVAVTLLKAMILANIGPQAYAQRLTALEQGDALSRVGAVMMAVGPATSNAAEAIGWIRTANF